MKARSLLCGITVMVMLLLTVVPPSLAQTNTQDPVLELMAQMSPEAKVGQLALVSFPGDVVVDNSEITNLIRDYHIGGVYLRPENGNFGTPSVNSTQFISLTNKLQATAWEASQDDDLPVGGESGTQYRSVFIPLFVSVEPGVAGTSVTQYIDGMATLPTPLSIGATWNTDLARDSGFMLGKQLSATGVNLYLGPDLDVLDTPRPEAESDLGTSVYGGDPFWVGQMGTAFIEGLHQGSEYQLMVIPRHLPGLGSADRAPIEEVPTVQKTLEQLEQMELLPFFAAASEDPGANSAADGFLVTHIRYRGFQGNIRQTTRPISLDAQALQLLTALDNLTSWRQGGGILVSDNLGVPSVHNFYDPYGVTFNARRVTQDALVAGNDLLIFDHFASTDDWTLHFTNVRDTLKFLAALYKDDAAFRSMVDAALYRVLSMKYRMYLTGTSEDAFTLDNVVIQHDEAQLILDDVNLNEAVGPQIASNSLTLLFPLVGDIRPSPPQEGEDIVIFTQEWSLNEAPNGAIPMMRSGDLAQSLNRFYGLDGTGTLSVDAVRSYTYPLLDLILDTPLESLSEEAADTEVGQLITEVWTALEEAEWIVFVTSDLQDAPDIGVLSKFLAEQASTTDGEIVVLAMGPPYALDSTEVSKLDLFYATFSTGEYFIDTAARALFGDAVPMGASPVDVIALDYSLEIQTVPDPSQLISFSIVNEAGETLTDTTQVNIHIGDLVNLKTKTILDRNGNIVPDGTPVQFQVSYPQESTQRTVWAETVQGIAQTSFTLDRVGQLDITALAEPALSSVRLELTIRDDGVTIAEFEPTPTPTSTPTSTPTPIPTAVPTATPIPDKIDQLPQPIVIPHPNRNALLGWGAFALIAVVIFGFFYSRDQSVNAVRALRMALVGACAGLSLYILLMLLVNFWSPTAYYYLIGREFLAGTLVLIGGGGVIAGQISLRNTHRRKQAKGPKESTGTQERLTNP